MFRRIATALLSFVVASTVFAQEPSAADLERRVRDLEQKLQGMRSSNASPDLAELQRQIEILTREIEALKTRQTETPATADAPKYGLGPAASKVYRAQPGVSIGGYGEFLYENPDGEVATADALRAVVYTGYKFNDRTLFNSELEVEHANLERGGNVELEFAYLDFLRNPALNFRAGMVIMPVGLVNEQHEPTSFLGATRPLVDRIIIPSTWSELGGGVFGDVGRVSYRAYVVTGLDAGGFGGEEGIREGRQGGGEAIAEDLAAVGRVDFTPFEGTVFGGSLYTGGSGQGAGFTGRVTLGEVHADAKFRGIALRALYSRGSIGDAAAINEANGLESDEGIGKRFGGWYAEAGYDISNIFGRGEATVTPYARYEQADTQRTAALGFVRNPANDQTALTVGVAFKPIPQAVFKLDWQDLDNEAGTGTNQWNFAVGYIF